MHFVGRDGSRIGNRFARIDTNCDVRRGTKMKNQNVTFFCVMTNKTKLQCLAYSRLVVFFCVVAKGSLGG